MKTFRLDTDMNRRKMMWKYTEICKQSKKVENRSLPQGYPRHQSCCDFFFFCLVNMLGFRITMKTNPGHVFERLSGLRLTKDGRPTPNVLGSIQWAGILN